MLKVCIIGSSGYTGSELVKLITRHPKMSLEACFVSENSQYTGLRIDQVHPELQGICDLPVHPFSDRDIHSTSEHFDAVFLATPHEFSHDVLPKFVTLANDPNSPTCRAKVFDLSGAFRLSNVDVFETFYGFKHTSPELAKNAIYGLAEWNADAMKGANYIAVPGCYPTASLLALKPLIEADLLELSHTPVINAVSGVSGAGRKASNTTSFYEVSLQAYGVLNHRHGPEIEEHCGTEVIFTPHLGAFKRGILATLTAFTKSDVTSEQIKEAYENAYNEHKMVRLRESMPKVDQVAHTGFCDISFNYDPKKQCVVVTSAIDNLLKGASSQAIQCCNLTFDLPSSTGLIS